MTSGVPKRGVGRPIGALSKRTDIKSLAAIYTTDALLCLINIVKKSKNEGNRILAAKELLDRAHGKPAQAVTGDPENPIPHTLRISWEK